MTDVAEVAERLYAVAPEDFVAARDAEVKRARSDGDRPLAAAVSKLPKPTTAAWLLNQLVRERPAQVRELVALGASMRTAQQNLSGAELRQLGRRRHEVIAAFTGIALQHAERSGRPAAAGLSAQVQETLGAAIADPAAGEALLSGRLTKGLSYGTGGGEADVFVPRPSNPARRAPSKREAADAQRRSRELEQALERVQQLADEARAADEAADAADREAGGAAAAVDPLRERVDELQTALEQARESLSRAEAESKEAARRRAAAHRRADELREQLAEAREAAERLDRG